MYAGIIGMFAAVALSQVKEPYITLEDALLVMGGIGLLEFVAILILFFKRGTDGPNVYGPNPLQ